MRQIEVYSVEYVAMFISSLGLYSLAAVTGVIIAGTATIVVAGITYNVVNNWSSYESSLKK